MIGTFLQVSDPALERFSSAWWTAFAVEVGVAIVVALAVSLIARRSVRRYKRRANDAGDEAEGRRRRRLATVVGLVGATVIVLAWVIVLATVLSAFRINLGPLIASAGIAGVALGFGAQTLVRDTISGLFLVIESQYDVGDTVDLETEGGLVSGTVEGLTLRVTSVRQYDGTLSTVPNGLVQISRNKTRGWGRAIVDVRVALTEDPDDVRHVLEPALAALAEEPPFSDSLRKAPEVIGVIQLTDVAQVIRVAAETEPSKRWVIERELRARVTAAMIDAGVKSPPIQSQRPDSGGVL